ncbi:MAG TPA: hypothetical protein EYP43_02780 [Thermoplasmata archaeon]|nr:hypothetical protein [Thermoplasmata archaeon]
MVQVTAETPAGGRTDAPGARADAGDVTAPGTGGPDATTVILGADALGRKGLPAEEVGGAAAGALIADLLSGATVDPHLSDMMVPYIALHGGGYTARVLTSHARTCIDVTNAFLPGSVWVSPPGEVRRADGLYVFTSSTG